MPRYQSVRSSPVLSKGNSTDIGISLNRIPSDNQRHTNNSFGVFLTSGSFNRQVSTKFSASAGNRPSGVSFGAGSFTICCKSSKILMVIPPPCKLTPLLFRRFFLSRFSFSAAFSAFISSADRSVRLLGRDVGDNVFSKSERSESSEDDSAKGNRPSASSINEMPRDHTSDLTVYCAPWIRSG